MTTQQRIEKTKEAIKKCDELIYESTLLMIQMQEIIDNAKKKDK